MQYYRVERNTSRVNREFRLKRTENMIYSPQQGIPLGEARKRKNGEVTEVVTLDKLHELVMHDDNKTSE